MDKADLAVLLRAAYDKGRAEATVSEQVLLFGIKHAAVMKTWTHGAHAALCDQAGIPPSLGTETRKGTRLAKYVDLKSE